MIIADIPEPAIQLREYDQVEVVSLHAVQQPDKLFSLVELLSCGQGFINECVNKYHPIHFDEIFKNQILRFERIAVKHLIIVTASDIFNYTKPEKLWVWSKKRHIKTFFLVAKEGLI